MKRVITNTIAAAALLVAASSTQAQATRTWVSGVGDDVNPCSRTAPCKTFAGAISKTAAGGEIDALDPGGFGAVTITKSITIDGTAGQGFGSILASGTNGVNVALVASANDPLQTVRLRNLNITGTGSNGSIGTRTGLNGIRITSAAVVYIEKVLVTDFTQRGISDERSASGLLYISDSTVRNNGNGIVLTPTAGTVNSTMDNVRSQGNVTAGFVVSGHALASI